MIFTKIRKGIFTVLLSGVALYAVNAQTTYYSKANGNWNAAAAWTLSPTHAGANAGPPAAGDIVIIGNGHTISTNNGNRTCLNLTINGSGILNINNNNNTVTVSGNFTMDGTSEIQGNNANRVLNVGGNFTVPATATNARISGQTVSITGTTTIAGTLTLNNNTGVKTFIGAVANTGSWTSTTINTTGNLVFRNGIANSGTFVAAAATFNTNNQSISGTANITFSNTVTITGVTVTNNNTASVILSNTGANSLTGTGTFIQGVNSTLQYAGSSTNITALNASASGNTITYTGGVQTVRGIDYYNLTLSGNNTKTLQSSITVSNSFTFSAATILSVNSSSNVTLGATATITGGATDRYIQLDGASGDDSNLIKVSANNTTSWQFTFPIGTATGGYTPVTIPTIAAAPDANSTLAVKVIYSSSQTGQLRRSFRFTVTGNDNGTTFSNAAFSYNDATDISGGDVEADYTTAWRSESGSLTTVTASINTGANTFTINGGTPATASLNTGTYSYTIGKPVEKVWYSYQTGNFSDFSTWTLDPSGTTFDNGLSLVPANGDEIHILNGYTVTVNLNNRSFSATEIQGGGILNVAATTGHNLGTITGTGLLRIQGTTLPTGTYTDFVATTGGTIEYYNTAGTLSATQTTYNNLMMTNSTGANIIYVLASNMTVNGLFELSTTGAGTVTWQINNGTANRRTIVLNKTLTVGTGGRILASSSGQTGPHILDIYGNFENNGIVKFFDTSDPQLSDPNYTSGSVYTLATKNNAVNVTFRGTADQTVTCNNTTDFYRFIVNKGSTQQPVLTVVSSGTNNMRLFGPANLGGTSIPSNNALSIANGTLQLTGTLTIPRICANGAGGAGADYYGIPPTGALWINGAGVSVTVADNNTGNDDQRILINGLLRISAGTLNSGYSRGLGSDTGGVLWIEGGTVNTWQYRPIVGSQNVSFIQSGGTFNVGMSGVSGPDDNPGTRNFARFSIPSATSSFQMTGGELNIGRAYTIAGGTPPANASGIDIRSDAGNYHVTGGTINAYISNGATNTFTIYATAPLYNLNIYRENGATLTAGLNSALTVLNDFTIVNGNTPTFTCNGNDLSIGGNFAIQANTTFTPGGILTFNGTGAQTWTRSGTISAVIPAVVVDKTGTLTVQNTLGQNITSLTLTNGTLADNGNTITVTGTLTNNATHTSTGTGSITYSGTNAIGGNNGTFGNLIISEATANNTVVTVATSGNQTVTGNLTLANTGGNANSGTCLNITSYALTVLGNINTSGTGLGVVKRIITSGLHNAGGLTRKGAAGDLLFPLGTGTLYTPNTINVTAATHGTITVRPVSSEHPNATTTGQSLQYYWRITSTGYAGITAVTHNSYTYSTATRSGTTGSYRPARFDPVNFTWGTRNTTFNAASATAIPDFNTNTGWTGVTGSQLNGEYTCGYETAFGAVVPYYSKGNGAWNANTGVWTDNPDHTTDNISGPPCSYCPVIIGNGTSINHTITIDANNRNAGTLSLNAGSTLNCSTFTGLDFGTNTTGIGTLRIASATFPAGDFLNFLGTAGGTVEWYGATKIVPSTYTGPSGSLNLNTYYNVVLNPNSGATITLPATNLTIHNNLEQGNAAAYTGTVLTNGSRTISITDNLTVSRGTFNFSNANPSVTTLTVGGNTTIANGATMTVVSGGTANTNTLTTPGGITNNGTLNFRNNGVVNITFTGTNNVNFNGTGNTTLNLVTVNKGTSQTPTVTFSTSGTVTTTAAATGWLTLTNGTFDFANTGTVSTTLSTSSYTIPSTAKLKVSGANVTVNTTSTNANANDLFLNGALEVAGGAVNVGLTTGTTNDVDVEYASAGTPTISVSGSGSLWVRSSVRRPTNTIAGALVYNQTGGTVTVGGIASNNTRGIFEIEYNTGSNFTLTSGTLNVQRQTSGTGYADVYINPVTSNVSATSAITVGLSTNTTQSNLRVYIVPVIGNFSVQNGNGTNAQTVMLYNDLAIGGTLTIPNPSVLNATTPDPDANVIIGGDFNCTGTYTAGTNTTTFNGAGAQSAALTSNTNFYNVTVNKPSSTVTVSGTAPAAPGLNNLSILSGTLEVGTAATPLNSTLKVNRDIIINGSQTGTQAVEVYSTTGISNTITSSGGTGSFTHLTLGGTDATARTINVTGNLGINGTLTFNTNRYLMIGSSGLTFGGSAAVSGAGTTAFVRTNGVSNDLGVTKSWTGNGTFVYPVGTSSNYTPVSYSLNVTNAGTLTVVPVNSAHVTYNQASAERILNYYWTVKRSASLNATASGSFTFSYPAAMISGSGGTLVAGYLDANSNPLGWATSGHGGSATTILMTFTSTPTTNFPAVGSYYDYSVGTTETLPNPILPLYSRLVTAAVANQNVGGNWTDNNSWTTQADGLGAAYTSAFSGPRGIPLVILPGARINMDVTGRTAYRTTIDGNATNKGLLYIGTSAGVPTTGHNLGAIDGTGTLRSSTNTFPAGDYTAFVSSAGGTIEYVGPMTMNNRNTYNHLSIIGTGTVTMTATNLVLNGNVSIASGATLGNAANNANMATAGNWINNGTFTPGTGTVTFNSASSQTITGVTTFNGITVTKTGSNLTLNTTTTVNGPLTLNNGHIITSSSNLLVLGVAATSTGASASSFVSGPMRKTINASGSFSFPLGSISANRFRPASISNTGATDTWTVEYVGHNPSDDGFNNFALNTANMAKVSMFEYWNVSRSGSSSASVTLSYNTGSYIPNPDNIGNVANLRVTRWNGTLWDLPPGGGSFSQSGDNITGTVTVTNVTSFSPFTFASLDANSPLPVELDKFGATVVPDGVSLFWETASEVNNDYFTVERSATGEGFTAIGRVNGKGTTSQRNKYTLKDTNPIYGKAYYRLRQTDFDGTFTFSKTISVIYDGPSIATMSVYPNPTRGGTVTIKIEGIDAESIPVIVYDQVGREVATIMLERDPQSKVLIKTVTFEKPLTNGLYILRAGSFLVKRLLVSN